MGSNRALLLPLMSHAPTDILSRRHQQIREAMRDQSLDALVVTALPNITYLTNFTGSSAIAVLTGDRMLFITDSRYQTNVADRQAGESACPDLDVALVEGSYDATLVQTLARCGVKQVGFEAAHLTVSRHQWIAARLHLQAPDSELCP